MNVNWDWQIAWEAMPRLMQGAWLTLLATVCGMALAIVLGLVLAILRRSEWKAISYPTAGAIEFIRSTPVLIQLFFVYFMMSDMGWNTPFLTGVLVLGIHYSTYASEAYRSGIDNVPRGQWEAAKALNLSPLDTWRRVIVPQSIPPVVPALGNYLVAMFKDTPLLYVITVREIFSRANDYTSRVGSYVEAYTLVGIIFLVMSLAAAALIRWTERKLVIRQA